MSSGRPAFEWVGSRMLESRQEAFGGLCALEFSLWYAGIYISDAVADFGYRSDTSFMASKLR